MNSVLGVDRLGVGSSGTDRQSFTFRWILWSTVLQERPGLRHLLVNDSTRLQVRSVNVCLLLLFTPALFVIKYSALPTQSSASKLEQLKHYSN